MCRFIGITIPIFMISIFCTEPFPLNISDTSQSILMTGEELIAYTFKNKIYHCKFSSRYTVNRTHYQYNTNNIIQK
jgi:hypothetical protein